MSKPDSAASDEAGVDERIPGYLGAMLAVSNVVIFTVIGELALGDIVYGGIVGVLAGVGTYLFLPWFLRLQSRQGESSDETSLSEAARRVQGSSRLGVAGLGLELGAIVMFAVGFTFAEGNLVVGTGVALIVAVSVYLAASVVLDL